MDFMSDAPRSTGRAFRLLSVVHCCSREDFATVPGSQFSEPSTWSPSSTRIAVPPRQAQGHPGRQRARPSPASCLISRIASTASSWTSPGPACPRNTLFSELSTPRVRAECLNASWFLSMADARDRLEACRIDYNTERPPFDARPLDPRSIRPERVAEGRKGRINRRTRDRGKTTLTMIYHFNGMNAWGAGHARPSGTAECLGSGMRVQPLSACREESGPCR